MKMPNRAYMPEYNERHPENTFDAIGETTAFGYNADPQALCEVYNTTTQLAPDQSPPRS